MTLQTNIKNLPEGEYFTEIGYSQQYPWVVIGRTAKTVKLAKVEVKADPEWKPEIIPGGFAGHCTNQHRQTWVFDRVNRSNTVSIRQTKIGWSNNGVRFIADRATEFYDYNF